MQVFRTDDFSKIATIPVGNLPHGIWPSGDGKRVYVGLENQDQMVAIDTLTNKLIAIVSIGQVPQALIYVPNAVPQGDGSQGLQLLGIAGEAAHVTLAAQEPRANSVETASTSVSLFDQGLVQVLQAAAAGLQPHQAYILALAAHADGSGLLEPLASFTTNPAGAAIVNTIGPIRQVVRSEDVSLRRYLVIAPGTGVEHGAPVQVQLP